MIKDAYDVMKMNRDKIILFKTIVGSHVWNMQRPNSDIDYFTAFAYPTKIFLMGYHPKLSYFYPGESYDEHLHEIEKVVTQLMSGNINFILGVISPKIVQTSLYHRELRKIVYEHPPKNIYNSIRGLAVHCYKLYVKKNKDTSEHRMNKILRVLEFGITLLKTGKYEFKPVKGATPELILEKLQELDAAYRNSTLEEKIPEQLLRNYLLRLRLDFLSR